MRFIVGLALLAGTLITATATGHFHMMLPSKPSVKKGEEVTITLQFGHPFEHQLFDMALPEKVLVIAPGGGATDVSKKLEQVALKGDKGKKVVGYRLKFTPTERGDYVFVMKSGKTYMEEDKETVQDTVKVVLHVQAQKGWHALAAEPLEWRPLTRPYALRAGMSFSAEVATGKSGWTGLGAPVEIERYNPAPPDRMPPDEEVTWTARTDSRGKVTATLPEAGWWGVTVTGEKDDGRKFGGKAKKPVDQSVRPRSTLWVHVNAARAEK